MNWESKKVLVTGGASFIGSHLTDGLVARGAEVRVADNLSSGDLENLNGHLNSGTIDFKEIDLLEPGAAAKMVDGMDVVFHLAADHGGRGYIDLHPVECSTNLILDGLMISNAAKAGVSNLIYASSGCVYPNFMQTDPEEIVYLTEDKVGPPFDADKIYGWAKLMAEKTIEAYCEAGKLKGCSLRYFTAYGPRCLENHAVMAMIARAYLGKDPFEIWGTGEQIRNWTHVSDIVEGTILAAEKIEDGTAINLGTMERIKVVDAAKEVLRHTQKNPQLAFDETKPTGPYNRVCDNSLASELLGWKPKIKFIDGLHSTIDWYFSTKEKVAISDSLAKRLLERKA